VIVVSEEAAWDSSPLCRLRRCISPGEVPVSDDFTLPEGYFALKEFRVEGRSAVFSGRIGPVPRRKPGFLLDACGTGIEIHLFRRDDGKWEVGQTVIQQC
jgi:hypothetical protein